MGTEKLEDKIINTLSYVTPLVITVGVLTAVTVLLAVTLDAVGHITGIPLIGQEGLIHKWLTS